MRSCGKFLEPEGPQITTWRMPIACLILRLQTHTQISTTTMVARMRLSVTLYVHFLSCINPIWTHSSFMKSYPMQYNKIQSYYFNYFCFYFRYVSEALNLKPANYRGGAFLAYKVSADPSLYRKFLLHCIISVIVGLCPQETCCYLPLFLPFEYTVSIHYFYHRVMYEGRLISNAHSEISRKRDHVFKQTKVGSKVQYFSYKLTYSFFNIVALSFNTFFPT